MRILIISRYFPPYDSIASLRPYSWAKCWSRLGHHVSVLTCDGGDTRTSFLNMGGKAVELVNVENGCYRLLDRLFSRAHSSCSSTVDLVENSPSKSLLSKLAKTYVNRVHDCRIPHVHDFWCSPALREIKGRKWDLVVSTYAPPVTHRIAHKLKKQDPTLFWIADFRDLWIEHTVAKGIFPFRLLETYLEKKYVNSADLVTTVSEPLVEVLRDKYPTANVQVVSNGFDKDDLEGIPCERIFSDDKVRLVYTGTLYENNRVPAPLFEAISLIAHDKECKKLLDRLEVLFVGANKFVLEPLVEKYQVSQWVKCQGRVPRQDALRMQRDAHALIFLEWEEAGVKGIMTGKIFEYLSAATEIWSIGGSGVVDESSASQLAIDAGVGKMFGKNVTAIKETLLDLLRERVKREVVPEVDVINKYERSFLARKMLDLALK